MALSYRYWRLACDSNQSTEFLGIGVEFFKISVAAGGASIFTGGTASASSVFGGGFEAVNILDDDTTAWASLQGAGNMPAWVQYDRGVGNAAEGCFLEFRGRPPSHIYSPKLLRLQGSNNGSTWDTLLSVNILGHTLTDRWVISSTGTLRIPFGHIVSGNSALATTAPVARVLLSEWASGKLIESLVPDAAGNWQSITVGSADVLVTHIGNSGYKPLADGPITPSVR